MFPGDAIRGVLEEGKGRRGKSVSRIVKASRKEHVLTTGRDNERARRTEPCQGEGNIVDGSGNVAPEKHTRGQRVLIATGGRTRSGVVYSVRPI